MAFPRKFKALLEMEADAVRRPQHLWATYVVCAVEPSSCGWGGWELEAAFADDDGAFKSLLPSSSQQVCPNCGKPTFRTAASFRYELSANQKPPLTKDLYYESSPMEYE
jgi:hypothetical protein